MRIGELARRADVPVDTVRYYERSGILPPALRRQSGYRDYAQADVRRLVFVRRAKQLGFTLSEIQELIKLSEGTNDMAALNLQAQAKLRDIDERMADLARMRDALHTLLDACPGHGALEYCPILAALSKPAP